MTLCSLEISLSLSFPYCFIVHPCCTDVMWRFGPILVFYEKRFGFLLKYLGCCLVIFISFQFFVSKCLTPSFRFQFPLGSKQFFLWHFCIFVFVVEANVEETSYCLPCFFLASDESIHLWFWWARKMQSRHTVTSHVSQKNRKSSPLCCEQGICCFDRIYRHISQLLPRKGEQLGDVGLVLWICVDSPHIQDKVYLYMWDRGMWLQHVHPLNGKMSMVYLFLLLKWQNHQIFKTEVRLQTICEIFW